MTWIYVPSASSASAPDTVASSLDFDLLASMLAPSVTWRGKPSPARTWSRRCKRVLWLKLLSGLISFDARPWRGVVDLITAGFPCQPFSAAGKRRGIDDERWVWPEVDRIVGVVRPAIVFLENVPGIVVRGLGPVLGSLAALGYDAQWGCLRASDVGASHWRDRWFCLAYTDRAVIRQQPWWGPRPGGEGASRLGRDSEALADGGGDGLGEQWRPGRHCSEDGEHASWDLSDRCDAPVADTNCSGPQIDAGVVGDARLQLPTTERSGWGLGDATGQPSGRLSVRAQPAESGPELAGPFPPGPQDLDGWERWVAAGGPEPGVRRAANGCAARLDRIRMLGNGVVPAQAAAAFAVLQGRILA